MEAIDTLKTLGCEVTVVGDRIKVRSLPGVNPYLSKIQPLIDEIRTWKQEALDYLSAQDAARTAHTKFCSWREMAVPSSECIKPCYLFDPPVVKECKHLLIWWKERLKWLHENNPKVLTAPKQVGTIPDKNLSPDGDAFDPDGALASLLECARRKGISDAQVASVVDDLIKSKSLKTPWGIRLKNSPILGNYWIVSDDQAKQLVTTQDVVFTQEDIRFLAEVREIFGIKSVEVKKYDTGKQAGS